jgi:hypothetical protein
MNLRHSLLAAATFAGIVACSSASSTTPPTPDYGGSCQLLANRCHSSSSTLGKECHELGHDGTDDKCGPRKDECLAACPMEDDDAATPVVDAGSPDATTSTEAGADASDGGAACAAYCTCMGATCAAEPAYPYANEAACLSACKSFDAKGRACVVAACETAKSAADKAHECEHAAGPSGCH